MPTILSTQWVEKGETQVSEGGVRQNCEGSLESLASTLQARHWQRTACAQLWPATLFL